MTTDYDAKTVVEPPKKLPASITQEILRAVASIEYGSVEIVIHDGRVVQIEYRGKIPLYKNSEEKDKLRLISHNTVPNETRRQISKK